MDDLIRRIIQWKERGKYAVRHGSFEELARIIQQVVNLGDEQEQEACQDRGPEMQGVG